MRIKFLVAGHYPGDGKHKPVAIPDPKTVAAEIGGIRYLGLPSLVQLKPASGMTGKGRRKDLGDVQELIRALGLDRGFAEKLDPYVRAMYVELWQDLQDAPPPD